MINTIALDLDGVFADFYGRYQELFGMSAKEATHKEKECHWRQFLDGDHFTTLDHLEGSYTLLDHIAKLKEKHALYICVITSAGGRGEVERIEKMKKQWVKNHSKLFNLVEDESNIFVTADAKSKRNYAKSDWLLIDDHSKNIDHFIEAGGHGIVHTSTHDTINQLRNFF